MEKLLSDPKQFLLVVGVDHNAVGFIKYSFRHLYFFTPKGKSVECDPICILDFFVLESFQRKGYGKLLLDKVAESVSADVSSFAYDRPSSKLIAFMRKNYNLVKPDLQPNKYAIFEGFSTVHHF